MLTAIKIYDKVKLTDQTRKRSVLREVTALKKLDHKNLPTLYDVIDSPS
jgi:serine/threonine protein kinase